MKLIVVDPGHFHASLLLKNMYPVLDNRVAVFAQPGPEILDYLNRVFLFNSRTSNPTAWEWDVHLSSSPMAEVLRDKPGNIVVFSGRNRGKIGRVEASLSAGLHVLADKPWIIESGEMQALEASLDLAERSGLAVYDIMTERYEVTSLLQRSLVNAPEIFGAIDTGTDADPAIRARSIHHVMKTVAGVPLRRPAWFFDIAEYGEGLADVGTHVVDLVQWTAFPGECIDYRTDIEIRNARRWPLTLTKAQFSKITGEPDFPAPLHPHVGDRGLDYYCNNSVDYTLRGTHAHLEIIWNWEANEGPGDVYEAAFRGSRAQVEIRQGKPESYIPEVYVVPGEPADHNRIVAAVRAKVSELQSSWPGLAAIDDGAAIRLSIPPHFRVGHEAHFGQVITRFFDYVKQPRSMPPWERAYMLAKYYVCTEGVAQAARQPIL
ncbi:MAG: putative oxidoreductase C-terminal domain-containing protein [Bryobacteraceae bacterium]